MRLDSHQHFWNLEKPFTDWPPADLAAIYRDFTPADLKLVLDASDITGTILVQAAPNIAETAYCLNIAEQNDFVKAVIGWIDFEAGDAVDQLDRLASNPLVKGLRPMVQAITTKGWLLQDRFGPIFEAMIARDLRLDGLVLTHQIPDLDALASTYPALPIVLDHAGKPLIAAGEFEPWGAHITKLAQNDNVHCKLSGLWTEAGSDISQENIWPWLEHLLATFGPDRLIWGSDWPVVELAGCYRAWLEQCETSLSGLSGPDRAAIFGGNARQFYGID